MRNITSKRVRLLGGLSLALALAFVAGCSDDETTAPTGQPALTEAQVFEASSEQVLSMMNDLIVNVPSLVQGDMSGITLGSGQNKMAQGDQPVWDAGEEAWVWAGVENWETADSSFDFAGSFYLQLRDDLDQPQQLFEGAAEMTIREGVDVSGSTATADGTATFDYSFETELTVGGLPDGPYALDGSGSSTLAATETTPSGSAEVSMAMSWALNVSFNQGGCPVGSLSVTSGAFSLEASYDGQGNVSWTAGNGGGWSASGSETVGCANQI